MSDPLSRLTAAIESELDLVRRGRNTLYGDDIIVCKTLSCVRNALRAAAAEEKPRDGGDAPITPCRKRAPGGAARAKGEAAVRGSWHRPQCPSQRRECHIRQHGFYRPARVPCFRSWRSFAGAVGHPHP